MKKTLNPFETPESNEDTGVYRIPKEDNKGVTLDSLRRRYIKFETRKVDALDHAKKRLTLLKEKIYNLEKGQNRINIQKQINEVSKLVQH